MLNVIMLSFVMLNVIMLSFVVLNAVMRSIVLLNVVAPFSVPKSVFKITSDWNNRLF